MGWCQAIVLVAYFGILQCDLSQTAKCNCNNKPTILQFRFPTLDTPLNYPFYSPMPYPYVNADKKLSDNQKKCSTPRCNTRLQPAAVKISIPTATKSGWTNIIIDTRKNPNATIEDCRPKPQKTNVNVFVQVGNSNKTLSSNSSEPAVSAKTNVSSTKDANGNHVTSVSSADDSKSVVSVTVKLHQTGNDGLGDSEDDFIVNSDSLAKDDEGNIAKSTSTTFIDEKDKNKAKPDTKPKTKVDPKPVKKDPTAKDTATHNPTTKNPEAKNPKAEKPVAKEPDAKKPEAEKPKAKKPEVEQPAPKKPVAEEPESKKPEVKKPEAEKPEAKKPETEKPEAEKPEAEKPEAEKPEAEKPEAEKPEAEKPEAEKPEAEKPEAEKPEAEKPEVKKPEAEEPVAKEAEGEKPVAKEPEAEKPVVEKPDAKEPVAEIPAADGADLETS